MNIKITRESLIEKLKAQVVLAKAEDQRKLKAHQHAEEVALQKFRLKLRAALKWDYKTARKSHHVYLEGPSCPRPEATSIEAILKMVELDQHKGDWSIKQGSDIGSALAWVPASKRPPDTLCD